MSNRKQPSSRGWIHSLVATALSLAVAVALLTNSRTLADSFNYYRYSPDPTIASFVTRAGMNDHGKYLFYASTPSLEGAGTFNSVCGRAETTTAILGCYNGQRIYVYDVQDPRLSGIRTTTAAHEMLHAAYDRLGAAEKERVDRLLETEFIALQTNGSMAERMAYYARTEPGERSNELHSIIGTEVASISDELERYYQKYFDDRSKVVQLHAQYESVFKNLQSRADELKRKIETLDGTIKNYTATYNERAATLKVDIRKFNERAEKGDFSSQQAFNTERQELLRRVSALDTLRTDINRATEEYNRLVIELNGIATETQELNRSIDSTLAQPPSL